MVWAKGMVTTTLSLDLRASLLAEKVKHYLVTAIDRVLEEATDYEFYQALSRALREEIIVNWAAMRRAQLESKQRMLYYLSMEYLPGRILTTNITNLRASELVTRVCRKLGRDLARTAACEIDLGLGNGGLGRLASCFLDSLATMGYPAIGYGLRYQYGIFDQEIWDGVQVERPDPWLLQDNPWHFRRDSNARSVNYCGRLLRTGNVHGDETFVLQDAEEVRALPYDIPVLGYCSDPYFSVATLRLWTTKESPRNFKLQRYNAGQLDQAAENTTLTDVLYPDDVHEVGKRIRLKQEFLLVSASVQDLLAHYFQNQQNLDAFPDSVAIQINDTHPAMVVCELMRLLNYEYELPWKKAWEYTQTVIGFTQHTVLKESLEEWDQDLFRYLLPRQYKVIERINHEFLEQVRKRFPDEKGRIRRLSILEGGKVRMAHLAICGSHKINGVAKLQSEILKEAVFPDFFDLYPERFLNITNGVTQRRWLLQCNPELSQFITDRIGPEWIVDFNQISRLADYASDEQSQRAFLDIKQRNKERLIEFLWAHNTLHDPHGQPLRNLPELSATSLFDVQVKRIHEYKRQLMNALHTIILYQELCANPHARAIKRTIIIGGKAAAGYRMAKNVIRLIYCLARQINGDTTIDGALKVVFVENYNVSRAELIIPAADLSQQISTAGLEASGTGNMKLAMNGALTLGTEDGANIEMRQLVGDRWWPFRFGSTADELQALRHSGYRSWDDYSRHSKIRAAVDALRDGSFATTDQERAIFQELYASLLEGEFGSAPDRFFVLHDLPAYAQAQKRVEELYANPSRWAECALHNIAGMAYFSTDRAIKEYAQQIWQLLPLKPEPQLIDRIRESYAEHAPTLSL
jgi:glycogen phosphorylase